MLQLFSREIDEVGQAQDDDRLALVLARDDYRVLLVRRLLRVDRRGCLIQPAVDGA
jgi:hypothetical protein